MNRPEIRHRSRFRVVAPSSGSFQSVVDEKLDLVKLTATRLRALVPLDQGEQSNDARRGDQGENDACFLLGHVGQHGNVWRDQSQEIGKEMQAKHMLPRLEF